ncbi:MAG: hypothetical protein ACRDY1_14725 [Acidimicrobiales bacterium]
MVTTVGIVAVDPVGPLTVPAGLARAEAIGNALLAVPAADPRHDGRIPAAYRSTPLTGPAAVTMVDRTSDVGVVAWAGQALVDLSVASGQSDYLAGAVSIGTGIQAHAADTRGAGGYTGGITARGARIRWKSTEHNIDLSVFVARLATETGSDLWSARAASAHRSVTSMWDPATGSFSVGRPTTGSPPTTADTPRT